MRAKLAKLHACYVVETSDSMLLVYIEIDVEIDVSICDVDVDNMSTFCQQREHAHAWRKFRR